MGRQLGWSCDQHEDRFDCPDAVVGWFTDGQPGLIIHDGGSSMLTIAFCPWCGASLD